MRASLVHAYLAAYVLLAGEVRAQVVENDALGLEHVVAAARAGRPDVRAAAARAQAADQRPSIVRRPPDPQVFASLDHLPTSFDGADASGGVQVSAPLGHVLRNRARVARAEASARRLEIERVALDVELDAAMAFFELRYARALGDVLARQVALLEQLVAGTLARYRSGAGSQAEVLRAQAELARTVAALRSVAGLREAAEGMLNAAMGREPGTPIPGLADPGFGEPPSLASALVAARDTRPELSSQRSSVDAATAEIDVMRGMYRPMIMVEAGGSYTMMEGPGIMGRLAFSVPIFRDRLRAGVSEARAMRSMAEAELEAMQRMIEGEVASAHGNLLASEARLDALWREVLPLARQAVDASLAQYAAGRAPLVTPIEAARSLFSLEAEALMAEMERGMARARLGRAMGRSAGAW